ncbi:hypothetical protein ACP26I_21585 (plasmid) [Cronobacter sakazakii]
MPEENINLTLSEQASFLKKIKSLGITLFSEEDTESSINQLAELIIQNQHFLDDTSASIEFVNILAESLDIIDKNTITEALRASLFCYWKSLIKRMKVDIFFFGRRENLLWLHGFLDKNMLANVILVEPNFEGEINEQLFSSQLNNSYAPFFIYDTYGSGILSSELIGYPLGIFSMDNLMVANNVPTGSGILGLTQLLMAEYQNLKNSGLTTVVIGNSYGLYAFPSDLRRLTANLSMHSLGITQAALFTEHLLERQPQVNHFVFCFGLFDLFCELINSKLDFNQQMIGTISLFTSRYKFAKIENNVYFTSNDIEVFSSLVEVQQDTDTLRSLYNELDNEKSLNIIQNEATSLFMSTQHLDPEEQMLISQDRSKAHSKNVKYTQSLQTNILLVKQIKEKIVRAGKTITWLIPPFPHAYVAHLNEEMKTTNQRFLRSLEDEHFRFVDLSGLDECQFSDFRDGDHLNYSGAQKVIAWLKKKEVNL